MSPQGRQGAEPEQEDELKYKFSSFLPLVFSNPVSQLNRGDRDLRVTRDQRGRKLRPTPGGQARGEQGGAQSTKREGGWGPGEAPDTGPRESDIQRPRLRWVEGGLEPQKGSGEERGWHSGREGEREGREGEGGGKLKGEGRDRTGEGTLRRRPSSGGQRVKRLRVNFRM